MCSSTRITFIMTFVRRAAFQQSSMAALCRPGLVAGPGGPCRWAPTTPSCPT